ncbi:MAG: acetate/propionate family kinase [Thermoleophilia bacterium]
MPQDRQQPPVLVVNAGSTGTKLSLVAPDDGARPLEAIGDAPKALAGVGHRIVHGGGRFTAPAVLDPGALVVLDDLADLAPLHNGPAVAAARDAMERFPGVPHVAVFDTAFHATLPPAASTYPVPARWRDEWGVRRYGFHGISVQWSTERAAAMIGRPAADLRLAVCHIGGGASVTAVRGGRSVATTMGFEPLEGVVMATRSGTIDPAIPFHLMSRHGLGPHEVEEALTRGSGLMGLAGTADMREVERRAAAGDPAAALTLEVHDARLAEAVAGMVPALGGLDAVVFTGGVGEGSARMRAAVGALLAPLGVEIGEDAGGTDDREVGAPGAAVRALVVHAREDAIIARAVREAGT